MVNILSFSDFSFEDAIIYAKIQKDAVIQSIQERRGRR